MPESSDKCQNSVIQGLKKIDVFVAFYKNRRTFGVLTRDYLQVS